MQSAKLSNTTKLTPRKNVNLIDFHLNLLYLGESLEEKRTSVRFQFEKQTQAVKEYISAII